MRFSLSLLVVIACGDNRPVATLITDAPVDASELPDSGSVGCCTLYPDIEAIQACSLPGPPQGVCATLACYIGTDDAGVDRFRRVEVCHRYPACSSLACVALACDEDTGICTCELPSGEYVSCDGAG
jgi:hypothetical protein